MTLLLETSLVVNDFSLAKLLLQIHYMLMLHDCSPFQQLIREIFHRKCYRASSLSMDSLNYYNQAYLAILEEWLVSANVSLCEENTLLFCDHYQQGSLLFQHQ